MKKLLVLLCLIPGSLAGSLARADWPTDAGVDVPVANVDSSATPSVVGDDQDGVFVIFSHSDATPSKTLRGEHFSAAGDRLWSVATADGGYLGKDLLGLSIGAIAYGQAFGITDGDGGFIAAYTPGSNGGPFSLDLQRFDENANPIWAPTGAFGGVQLLATPAYYSDFWAIPDQRGGALVTFIGSGGIIGQRVDSTGAQDYGTGYLFANGQYPGPFYPSAFLSADGLGGMYYIWPPTGSEGNNPTIDYLNASGILGFAVPSVAPQFAYFEDWSIAGLPGGAGCWAAWDQPVTTSYGIYLQLFLSDGGTAFPDAGPANGLLVAPSTVYTTNPTLMNDGSGGVVVAWFDQAAGGTNVLYAQRYGPDGSPVWGAHPTLVSSATSAPVNNLPYLPVFRLILSTDGDPVLLWSSPPSNVYAEKLDLAAGTRLWSPLSGGLQVSSAATTVQWLDATFVGDDSAYVTYQDGQNHVYLKHVLADGTLGTETVADAGSDAGTIVDAGTPSDAGTTIDAGTTVDAGTTTDAGTGLDAGTTTDAGPSDAGPHVDAGPDAGKAIADAGGTPDAGNPADAGANTSTSGCGCASTATGSPWTMGLLLLGLVTARRRRRAP